MPFSVNPRGVLVHRVKFVCSHFDVFDQEMRHTTHQWCGNMAHATELVSVPPDGRLLCARCEAAAVKAGEKPSAELVGKHVCLGAIRAKRLCCLNEEN